MCSHSIVNGCQRWKNRNSFSFHFESLYVCFVFSSLLLLLFNVQCMNAKRDFKLSNFHLKCENLFFSFFAAKRNQFVMFQGRVVHVPFHIPYIIFIQCQTTWKINFQKEISFPLSKHINAIERLTSHFSFVLSFQFSIRSFVLVHDFQYVHNTQSHA